jgi:hypothetical protein
MRGRVFDPVDAPKARAGPRTQVEPSSCAESLATKPLPALPRGNYLVRPHHFVVFVLQ